MKIKNVNEIKLIRHLAKNFRLDKSVIKGPGDDAAVIKWTKNKYLLFTCDMLIEDIHFKRNRATPFQIGWKALGRNISDIAAMGGVPLYAVVSLGINPDFDISIAEGICKGLKSIADKFHVNIVGGDMAQSKKIVMDISVIGCVEKDKVVFRSGAHKDDIIFVTGSLGGSIKRKHLNFVPRVDEIRKILRNFKINSMIDVSDGLVLDLKRLIDASNVGACIYEESIPLSKDAIRLENALYDGEDYELLFTISPAYAEKLLKWNFARAGIRISIIGEVTDKKHGYKILRNDGSKQDISVKGYMHF